MQSIILASASPRRKTLLAQLGIQFKVVPADIKEGALDGEAPSHLVLRLAKEKALHVQSQHPDCMVLGADTLVILDQTVMGKPKNSADAVDILTMLSGRTHEVLTGVALATGDGESRTRICVSRVAFRLLSAAEIHAYVETGESMGKAGAYAIQGKAACFIQRLEGSYSSVMGLPLFETAELLSAAGKPIV